MAPPLYADLGKASKDLFNKGYNYGNVKLDIKTKTESDISFKLTGEHNTDSQRALGTLEAEYKAAEYGLSFVEKWNTDNILRSEISIEDQLLKGLKLGIDTSYSPATGKKAAIVKATFKHDKFVSNTDIDLDAAGPFIHKAIVVSHLGWLLVYQGTFDTSKSQLTRNNFALGYAARDFTLHANLNDGNEVGSSLYHKVNEQLEMGVSLTWSSGGQGPTRFAIASKYKLDQLSTVQAKVNNASQIGLSYSQQLRDGVKFIVSGLIDGKNINGGGHKLGLGLEMNA